MKPDVSVVIPTYRRCDLLARVLDAVLAQSLSPLMYEVIVVDDEPGEATRALVTARAAATKVPLRYVANTGRHGPAAARNRGWRQSRASVVAFTDDDTVPDREWLAHGLAAMTRDVSAARGRVVMPLPATPTDYEKDAAGLERAEFVTANCFVRRVALEDVGGFDERFRVAWREDADLQFALIERGHRIVDAPHAVVVHPVRPAPWGVSLSQQRKSQYDALLYAKHRALFRERIAGAPAGYYGALTSLAAGAGGALAGATWLAAAGLLAWTAWTLRFAARRLDGTSHAPLHVLEMLVTSALIPPVAVFWRLYGAWKFRVRFL